MRNEQIDFVKCVMILLMVAFHLVFIGDTYGAAKSFVYTFHMPVFLFLSGLLLNVDKPWKTFGRSMAFIAIPYAIMESGYIVGASVMPIREHIDNLTPAVFIDKLVLNPIGPYWYLQTILICSIGYKTVSWVMRKAGCRGDIPMLLVLVGIYELISLPHFIAWSSYMYFTFGIMGRMLIRRMQKKITDITFPGYWSGVLVFVLLAVFVRNPQRESLVGIVITAMAFCTSIQIHRFVSKYAPRFNDVCLLIGRNTLLILLFSPVFTILAKIYQPLVLAVDSTGMLFMVISVSIAIAGSLAIGWLSDFIGISPYVFGRQALVSARKRDAK